MDILYVYIFVNTPKHNFCNAGVLADDKLILTILIAPDRNDGLCSVEVRSCNVSV